MSLHDWKFHCAVLNVPEHASAREIKDAYRKLAQRFHPDHNGGTQQAKEKFQRINASYHYLSKNIASRPVLQNSEPISSPPPPPPPAYAKERAGTGRQTGPLGQWSKKIIKYFQFNSVPQAPLLIGGFLLAATLALGVIFRNVSVSPPPAEEAPKLTSLEVTPDARVDSFGRPKGRCEFASFLNGKLIARSINDLSENDCSLGCYSWVEKYKQNDAGCDWEGKTLVQHMAAAPDRIPASPPQKQERGIVFLLNQIPPGDGRVPTEWRETRIGEEPVVTMTFVPIVWIEDNNLIHARQGLHPNQVILTPIRRGATGIFLTDPNGSRMRKIVYDIK